MSKTLVRMISIRSVTVGRILRMLKLPDGRAKTLVQGVSKVKIKRYVRKRGFYRVKIEVLEEVPLEELNIEVEALMRNVREFSEKILALRGELTSDVSAILESIENPGKLADLVASNLKLKIDEAQGNSGNDRPRFNALKRSIPFYRGR